MKQQEILKKISNILHELNEQFDYLQAEQANYNDLELELFAANAKFLTDHTEILRKINLQSMSAVFTLPEHIEVNQAPAQETQPVIILRENGKSIEDNSLPPLSETALVYDIPTITAEEKIEQEPIPAYTPEPIVEPQIAQLPAQETAPEISIEPAAGQNTFNFQRTDPDVSSNSHSFSIASTHTEEEKPPHVNFTEEVKPEQPVMLHQAVEPQENKQIEPDNTAFIQPPPAAAVSQPNAEITPLPDPQKTEPEQPLTLNQRLSAQLQQHTPAQSQVINNQPVTDIKSAINLNDKMLFVKDLFNGYSLAYSEAVDLLNRCKSFDEADRFLRSNYVAKNNWATKPDTVDKFYMILHRRFSA